MDGNMPRKLGNLRVYHLAAELRRLNGENVRNYHHAHGTHVRLLRGPVVHAQPFLHCVQPYPLHHHYHPMRPPSCARGQPTL